MCARGTPHLYSWYKMWRHYVEFSPKVQEMFVFMILSCGIIIKSFAPQRKFWTILYFLCLYYGNICIYYGNIYKTVHNFHLNGTNDLIFTPQLKGAVSPKITLPFFWLVWKYIKNLEQCKRPHLKSCSRCRDISLQSLSNVTSRVPNMKTWKH